MGFCVRIANKTILIESSNTSLENMCNDYLVEAFGRPDIEIHINDALLKKEFTRAKQFNTEIYRPSSVEGRLIHRIIAEALLDYDVVLMHGAVVAVENSAYMFTGKSGTGKTTHIQKWLANAEGSIVINGDKPFLICQDDGTFVCGNPWRGKEHLGVNLIVPLRSIVIMERGDKNHIEQISFKSAFPKLLEQTYQPSEADKMRKTLKLLLRLTNNVSFYKFVFDNFQEDAFEISYNALIK